jgi:hypothetical protein
MTFSISIIMGEPPLPGTEEGDQVDLILDGPGEEELALLLLILEKAGAIKEVKSIVAVEPPNTFHPSDN